MEKKKMAALPVLVLLFIFRLPSEVLPVATTPPNLDFSYMKLVSNATELPLEEEYDYIVVGGGTAGCPLATTLSANYRVLLLERGGVPLENPHILKAVGFVPNLMQEDDGNTAGQRFTSQDGVTSIRGRVLGGTSMINLGFYSRAEESFFHESGIELDMDLVEKSFQWVEDTVVFQPDPKIFQASFRDSLLEANLLPDHGFSVRHTLGTRVGGTTFDRNGRRHGAVGLLNKAVSKNLQVAVHATVERIIFSSKPSLSAVGVIYSDSNGKTHQAFVRNKGEIFLSAGTLGSTQLMLLSGVGPHQYLSSLQIPVVLHQPHVGDHIADIPRNSINFEIPFPMEPANIQVVGNSRNDYYIEAAAYNMPFHFPAPFSLFPNPSPPIELIMATIMEKLSRPLSRGSFWLASSTDVKATPNVRYNYFEHPKDMEICVSAMRKIGELMTTPAMDKFKFTDLQGRKYFKYIGPALPENLSDDAAMEAFCKNTVNTFWHYNGGCVVGKVVDSHLKVMGIDKLRIVDGSILTASPGTNPHATLMMLGRYMGTRITQERMAQGLDII